MAVCSTLQDALAATPQERYDGPAFAGTVDRYFGSDTVVERPGPQAYRVRQSPGWVLPLHFHFQDEYQVVTGGSGMLGTHQLARGAVHYASREAAYGPLVAGPDGLEYFTLRRNGDIHTCYLPEARDRMHLGLAKRQVVAACPALKELRACAEVIPPQEDGTAAWLLRLPAGDGLEVPHAAEGGGRFYLVMEGVFVLEGHRLPEQACLFNEAESAAPALVAGVDGAEMLVLQFPLDDAPGVRSRAR